MEQKMIKIVSIIALATLLSACSSSQASYAEKSAENDQEYERIAKNKNMVCEYKATTGSHRKKRTCMTKKLSKEIQRRNQAAMRSQENKGQTSTNSK